ncbi:MAG: hypothetical protein P4L31_04590 [Candidatus Babeliales bacterium]|nr:hypothetical protein [Candidatus Babeliales bacterium]
MNPNSIKFVICTLSVLSTSCFMHAAQPKNSLTSPPVCNNEQQHALIAFKKSWNYGNDKPTDSTFGQLVMQDLIHPDNLRYGIDDQYCALGGAIQASNQSLAQFLLYYGANPNDVHSYYKEPIIMHADSIETAQLLIDYEAEITSCGAPLLCRIITHNLNPDLIPLYINNGADPNASSFGQTPLISLGIKYLTSLNYTNQLLAPKTRLYAQHLIAGGACLDHTSQTVGLVGYTFAQILKKKLEEQQSLLERSKNDSTLQEYSYKHCQETQKTIDHIKQLADKRRKYIHQLVTQQLPITNGTNSYVLADLVTHYYEPTYQELQDEPYPCPID